MSDLIDEVHRLVDAKSNLILQDATATGANAVKVGSSTVAVTLPAIIPVVSGQFCQVLTQGPNRVILGPVSTAWTNLTLASANWTSTETPQWRYEGGRVWLRGFVTRTTSNFGTGGTLFTLGASGNPPNPGRDYRLTGGGEIAAMTPDADVIGWFVDTTAGTFRSRSTTHNLAIGDGVELNLISWPA